MTHNDKIYWLADEAKKVVDHLEDEGETWGSATSDPFRQAWIRNYLAYYSPVLDLNSTDTALLFEGAQGELTRLYTPKARTYIRDLTGIITKQRISVQAMCETDGKDVVEDVKLANALCDQIIQNERLDVKAKSLVEGALVCGAWFMKTIWRTDLGQPYTRDGYGNLIYTGGVDITLHSPFAVKYDVFCPHWENLGWVRVETTKNRWDLKAQHPDLADEIMDLPEAVNDRKFRGAGYSDEDMVTVYELYVRPSPAIPKGRILIYSDSKTIYADEDNEYGTIPVEPMMPEAVLDTGLGYPRFTNLLPAQEMFDNSLSAIATNQSQFAVQSVTVARGAGISVNELNGMRFVSFTPQNVPGGGKPEPLQLTQSSPETFKFTEVLDRLMGDMGGSLGALRGNLPAGVTSGAAIATLSANALEFTEDIGLNYRTCLEKTMHHALNAYKVFAKLPHRLEVKGNNSKVSYKEFQGSDLKNISGIKFITSNPLMQTISGRLEIGEKIMSMPKDLWPKYTAILEGRPFNNLFKTELSEEDLIQSENEDLMAGEEVHALATDDHAVHIREHAGLLNDQSVRRNSTAVPGILAHIEEHKILAQQSDPFLIAMVRTGKMPDMPPPQQGGQGPGAPPGLPPVIAQQPGMPTPLPAGEAEDMLGRA